MSDAVIIGWEGALMAAEKVKERLRQATRALDQASVPYAVAGDNAVAEWVGRVDDEAVRNTRDVDLVIRRADFPVCRRGGIRCGACAPPRPKRIVLFQTNPACVHKPGGCLGISGSARTKPNRPWRRCVHRAFSKPP
jgi:hypothetical protein